MKSYVIQLLACILSVIFVCVNQARAQQNLSIDEFNDPSVKSYSGYASNPVYVQEGYNVYYERAKVRIYRIKVTPSDNTNKALQIQYELPTYFSWGNWLSIRREFKTPLNLSEYRGLEMGVATFP